MKRKILIIAITAFCLAAGSLPAQAIRLRLAEIHPQDHPTAKGDREFARLVKERSAGRIDITVYTDAELGQERAVLEQVQFGGIDIARVSLSAMSAFDPVLDALQMPYLYRDDAHLWKVLKGDIGRELLAGLETSGFVGLGWFEAGSRSFYNSKRPVKAPEDLKGMRIRVQESSLMMDLVTAFGATPVPMAYGDVYSALLTGTIDGAENNWPSYYSWSHQRVAPYMTIDEHTSVPEVIVGSKISMDLLSTQDRSLLADCAAAALEYQRAQWAAYERLAVDGAAAAGVVVTRIEDKSVWRARMEPLYARQSRAVREIIRRVKAVK
jgi:tripartite ATP-independent transporter DctP family solute receptor